MTAARNAEMELLEKDLTDKRAVVQQNLVVLEQLRARPLDHPAERC